MVSRFSEYRFRYDAGKTLLIALLLLVSFGMRILGIDWDQGVMCITLMSGPYYEGLGAFIPCR